MPVRASSSSLESALARLVDLVGNPDPERGRLDGLERDEDALPAFFC